MTPGTPSPLPARSATAVAVATLFFLSGFAGLIYQVLWMRDLGLLFGTTAHAAATTVAAFFLGLGVGSAFFGAKPRLSRRPLFAYGILELLVSLSALLFFGLFRLYELAYPSLFGALGSESRLLVVAKFLLALAVLFPPAFFMGGTLPVISRFVSQSFGASRFGRLVPVFYGINTFGASVGALAAGFFLPQWLGLTNSYWLAIATTSIAGLVALFLSRAHGETRAASQAIAIRSGQFSRLPKTVLFLAFFSGFSTLALEVLWIRMFAQTLQNSVYSYAIIIVIFLIALAIGAWIAAWLAKRFQAKSGAVMVWLLLLAGIFTFASPTLFHYFGSDEGTNLGGSENWPEYLRLVFLATGITIFPATLALGTIFPFLIHASNRDDETDGGQVVGTLAAVNTIGAVTGSLAAGFFLLDWIGLWSAIRLVSVCYLLLVFLYPLLSRNSLDEGQSPFRREALFAALALVIGLTVVDPTELPKVYYSPLKRKESALEVKEGSDATVAIIRRDDSLRMKVNNFYVLGNTAAANAERFQSHLPLIIHPEPESVFLLGLGTGITAGGAIQIEEVESLTVTELLPGVISASREYFEPWLNGLFTDERVEVVAEDGRNFLAATDAHYDVIVADLFLPWRSGVGNLYTVDHYRRSLERLSSGGIYAQWLPLYQLSEEEFSIIANSMREVFPLVTVWRGDFLTDKSIGCLIGHRDVSSLNWDVFQERSVRINRELGINQIAPFNALPGHLRFYAGNLSGPGLFADTPLNTDDFPRIEYLAPVTHRAEKADEMGRFTGRPLLDFFDKLRSEVPLQDDPWLTSVPEKFYPIVDAGHVLHELNLAQAEKNQVGEYVASSELRKIAGALEALHKSEP